jgi:peptidoglycan/xylan/chitin deacetylase (PgdA/CDA1 family)
MPRWKQLLLSAYLGATWPARQRAAHRRAALGQAPIMVLFYHRIADFCPNPWTASNRTFARQVAWLRRHFDLVSLSEARRRVASGSNFRPAVSITFDDGYADNCQSALPLLVDQGIPCTYFVSTRFVLDGQPFPHDAARGLPLAPNTPHQIQLLAAAGVEIGAHTRTHANLGPVRDPARLRDELHGARADLQALTGQPIRYFAFPYGQFDNLNPLAFALAREAGFAAVCSAYGGYNFPGDDDFHLQRIHVDDDLVRLQNWTTVDPRKLRRARRYEYRSDPAWTAPPVPPHLAAPLSPAAVSLPEPCPC